MTLAELQALAMRQAIAKLDRLHVRARQAEVREQDPKAERPRGWLHPDYLQEEIDDQAMQIAKLTYLHEREQSELDRADEQHALRRQETMARIFELGHLTGHREAILAVFKESNAIAKENARIIEAALVEIARAIGGREGP